MIRALPERRQQRLAVGLLCLVLLLAMLAIVLPIWTANASYVDHIDQLQTRLAQLHTRAEADGALRPRYEKLMRSQTVSGHHLKSDTEAVAAAELQRIVKKITGDNGTQILSTQILPASEEQDFIRIGLRVRLRGPLDGIIQALYDMEANATFLFFDKLSIRDGARRRRMRLNQVNQFDSDFELIAYMPKPL